MAQEINLNVSPYFDDFDATKDFHKVLFKPGLPIQARELTTFTVNPSKSNRASRNTLV